jgi:Rrf2 family protein
MARRVEMAAPSAHSGGMLSQKSRYAIRALQHLADRFGQGVVPMAEIVAAQNIPAKFLTVILSELGREGLVRSQRGRDGGYVQAQAPSEIRVGDIIRLMRGSIALVPCASRDPHEHCEHCVPEAECRLRSLMLRVRDETARILDGVTLADPFPTANLELAEGKP